MRDDRVRKLAIRVREEDEIMKKTISGERRLKAGFLDCLVTYVKEALPSICSRVVRHESGTVKGKGNARLACESRVYFDWKGVFVGGCDRPDVIAVLQRGQNERLIDRSDGRRVIVSRDRGEVVESLGGKGLFLAEDGVFKRLTFHGEVERDASYEWVAEAASLTTSQVSEERWSEADILEGLVEELEAQIKGKSKATAKVEKTIEKLRACTAILRG